MYDILDYSIKNKIVGHAILVDFKKAFNSISHKFLKSTLKVFNFSDKIVHWINTILSDFSSQTLVNGHLGEIIELLRGCRQGDPIKGYLFILAIEILLMKLRSTTTIHPWTSRQGIKLLEEGYADDLTILLRSLGLRMDIHQVKEVLKILDGFKEISGLTVNKGKTQICTFGLIVDTDCKTLYDNTRIKNVNTFKLLGIEFTHDLQGKERNYEYALDKFQKDLFSWINLKLSNDEKAMVVKVYGMPKYNHIATILPDPTKETLKRIEDCTVKFIQAGS